MYTHANKSNHQTIEDLQSTIKQQRAVIEDLKYLLFSREEKMNAEILQLASKVTATFDRVNTTLGNTGKTTHLRVVHLRQF